LWFTAFVGLNLFQSGFTGFCPAETIFCKLGAKRPGMNVPPPASFSLTWTDHAWLNFVNLPRKAGIYSSPW
jgi:hypothetical protein